MFHTPLNQVNTFEPSYAVTNARIGYTIPKSDVRVAVYVNNLFDKNYALNRSYVAFANYNTANFARPREWGVSLAVDFYDRDRRDETLTPSSTFSGAGGSRGGPVASSTGRSAASFSARHRRRPDPAAGAFPAGKCAGHRRPGLSDRRGRRSATTDGGKETESRRGQGAFPDTPPYRPYRRCAGAHDRPLASIQRSTTRSLWPAGIGPSRVGYAQSLSSCRTGPGDDRRAGQAAALQNCVGARPSLKARRADAHLSRCPCPRDRGYDRPLSLSERITRSPLLALVCLSH